MPGVLLGVRVTPSDRGVEWGIAGETYVPWVPNKTRGGWAEDTRRHTKTHEASGTRPAYCPPNLSGISPEETFKLFRV